MPYKRKEARVGEHKVEVKTRPPKVKLKKKKVSRTYWKDGVKHIEYSDNSKNKAKAEAYIEYLSERAGASSRKILEKKK